MNASQWSRKDGREGAERRWFLGLFCSFMLSLSSQIMALMSVSSFITTITRFFSLPIKESPMESNGSGQSGVQRSCLAEHVINTARVRDLIPTKKSLRSRYGKDASDKSLSQMAYISSSSDKSTLSALCLISALL